MKSKSDTKEYSRFSSLSKYRRDSIVRAKKWVVDNAKERFFIWIGKMDHIPYNVRIDEKMPDPLDYWLIGYHSIIYGIETKRDKTIIEDNDVITTYSPTIIYIPQIHSDSSKLLLDNCCTLLMWTF